GRAGEMAMRRTGWMLTMLAAASCPPGGARAAGPAEPTLERCLVSLIDEAKVPAREAGVLVQLTVREGDMVSRDEVIARIDDNQPQMERRKAKAEHEQAVAKAASDVDVRYSNKARQVAFKAWEKAENAHKQSPGSVTEVERDRLRLEAEKTDLQIEQAELERKLSALAAAAKGVEVEAADNSIERRLIKAPLDGVVVQVFPHQGEWMQPGDPLARVVRTDKLKVEGYVDAARWDPELVRDRPVTVEVQLANERRERFTGRIVVVSPLDESGGDYRVVAEVENRRDEASKQWLLRAGKTASMTVHSLRQPLPTTRRAAAP
ncbi:MAG: efflux RND transporter periplasmic adaptor subunit, partial [Planctomycetia bacterium]